MPTNHAHIGEHRENVAPAEGNKLSPFLKQATWRVCKKSGHKLEH